MTDHYIYFIIALLPLSALMSVLQVNPYNALVIRAILGAVAALVDAVLGAADVALTEALVGTMLAVTLYVIAVRSSLVMRLGIVPTKVKSDIEYVLELAGIGIVKEKRANKETNDQLRYDQLISYDRLSSLKKSLFNKVETEQEGSVAELISHLRKIIQKHHLRLELVEYPNSEALEQALMAKEVHAICTKQEQSDRILIRVHRLFEIIQTELTLPGTILKYESVTNMEEKH